MDLSPQAWIIGIFYLLMMIIIVICSLILGAFSGGTFIAVIIVLLFVALIMYDTNCLTAGNCYAWSWIRTILYLISILTTISAVVTVTYNIRKNTSSWIPIQQESINKDHFIGYPVVSEEQKNVYNSLINNTKYRIKAIEQNFFV